MNSCVTLFPFGNKIIVVGFGVTLLQREALETKAVGGASTVTGGGCRLHYLDSAQRAVQSKGDSRKPTETNRECVWSCDCRMRCGREKLRLAAATSERYRIATSRANV